jgi:hypothetical protein
MGTTPFRALSIRGHNENKSEPVKHETVVLSGAGDTGNVQEKTVGINRASVRQNSLERKRDYPARTEKINLTKSIS